jgi:hypothetical protein
MHKANNTKEMNSNDEFFSTCNTDTTPQRVKTEISLCGLDMY